MCTLVFSDGVCPGENILDASLRLISRAFLDAKCKTEKAVIIFELLSFR